MLIKTKKKIVSQENSKKNQKTVDCQTLKNRIFRLSIKDFYDDKKLKLFTDYKEVL